jgi:predicted O-linked N-acetylglucosamine transferase (SPINDLY family)
MFNYVFKAAWWGHPVTSGIESIDFFFGLDIEVPLAAEYYSEQLIRIDMMNSAPIKQV